MRVIIENQFIKMFENDESAYEIRMNISRKTTIEKLKEKVSKITSIPTKYFHLIRLPNREERMDTARSLANYMDTVRLRMDIDVPQRAGLVEITVGCLTSIIGTFCVDLDDPIALLQYWIQDKIGVPIPQQRLIHGGKQLEGRHSLRDYKIYPGSTLHFIIRYGGPVHSEESFSRA